MNNLKNTFYEPAFAHRFKRIGLLISPVSFVCWCAMQRGYLLAALQKLWTYNSIQTEKLLHYIQVSVAVVSVFGFLGGLYFIAFSREKVEDEMVQRIRLDSFQFAALCQMILILLSFACLAILSDPGAEGMLLLFVSLVFLFWIIYILRFNYIMHIRFR